MALTTQEFEQLKAHWPLVIQAIYPAIDEIPKGQGATIAALLSTWRGGLDKPTAAQIEAALRDTVLPLLEATEQARQETEAERSEVRNAKAAAAIDAITANIDLLDLGPTNAEVVAIVRQTLVNQRAIIRALRHLV